MPKISSLSIASALSGAELIPIVQSGETVRTSLSTVNTYLSSTYLRIPTLLSASATLSGGELLSISQGGNTVRTSLSTVNTYLSSTYLRIPTLLSASATLSGGELLSISQGGNTVRTSLSTVNTYLSSTYLPLPTSVTPSTNYALPLPANGRYIGEKLEYFIRPTVLVDLSFNASIKIPSDSGLTLPKTLTANELYIVVLRWNGTAWMLVSLVGGYA